MPADVVPAVMLAIIMPAVVVPALPLGHDAGRIAPTQGPMPGTGYAARNAAFVRVLGTIGRSRN